VYFVYCTTEVCVPVDVVGIPVFVVGDLFVATFGSVVELKVCFSRFCIIRVGCDFSCIALPTTFVKDVTVVSYLWGGAARFLDELQKTCEVYGRVTQ
jgi:hypothetical protein